MRDRDEALFAAMAQQDFEGIVGKRLDAPYNSGRQRTWVKVKNPNYSRQDAIIGYGPTGECLNGASGAPGWGTGSRQT